MQAGRQECREAGAPTQAVAGTRNPGRTRRTGSPRHPGKRQRQACRQRNLMVRFQVRGEAGGRQASSRKESVEFRILQRQTGTGRRCA